MKPYIIQLRLYLSFIHFKLYMYKKTYNGLFLNDIVYVVQTNIVRKAVYLFKFQVNN